MDPINIREPIKLKCDLPLEAASAMIDAALSSARASDLHPLTVVVLDRGGHIIALKREDGSSNLRVEVAVGKAWGALGMGMPSRGVVERLGDSEPMLNALAVASGGRFVPLPGGVLIADGEGAVIGAVGVTGDGSEADEKCAIDGIKAAGFQAIPDPA
ncbi:MAG: heme-binding protein [Rhodospirillales bacterium]|nr:heme-binding protein [Rhodospirillales bacterium]